MKSDILISIVAILLLIILLPLVFFPALYDTLKEQRQYKRREKEELRKFQEENK
jgi:hypothetical protein